MSAHTSMKAKHEEEKFTQGEGMKTIN